MSHPAIAGLPLVLGGNVFGWTADRDAGFKVLDGFYQAGGRMIDTADVYSAWVPGHRGGESEAMIGEWLESRGVRGEMRIHTKTGMLGGNELYAPERVRQSLDASLERLRTDYVDLYYAHRDYDELAIEDIVRAFDGAARSGKARALGASQFGAARLAEALNAAAKRGATPFTVLQNEYNVLNRADFGPELQRLCAGHGIAMLPYYGLAAGYLTGKYRSPDDLKTSARGFRAKDFLERGAPVLAAMDAVAAETGASMAAIALAWLRRQPGIAAPIASARTIEQLGPLIESTRLELSEDQLARLTAVGLS
jgi:aryl-alcohol dehydrogenase-like predicted oxidoreductase